MPNTVVFNDFAEFWFYTRTLTENQRETILFGIKLSIRLKKDIFARISGIGYTLR